MENASKALLMAGSVLIALMIIGALLLMFNNLSSYQEADIQTTREAQVIEFNNQYETYNRKNVRGSDLYSLLNRVVDYNKRKSTSGTGLKDEGQYIAYAPMTINYDLDGKAGDLAWDKSDIKIFTGQYANYSLNQANTNDFETHIKEKIAEAESIGTNETGMQNLSSGIDNLFNKKSEKDKRIAIKLWNANAKEKTDASKGINEQYDAIDTEDNKDKISTYYEFMQFKRAKFECIDNGVKYNEKTGRITEMKFKFTGKIE